MKRAMILILLLAFQAVPVKAATGDYRKAAEEAASWIRTAAVQSKEGTAWLADPNDKKSVSTNLYAGVSGVVLFFLEAYNTTKNPAYLKDAIAGAEYLIARMDDEKDSGLYTGLAGIGFAFLETYKVTRIDRYRQAAIHSTHLLKELATKSSNGVVWNDTYDIIAGNAGTGLFLLYAAKTLRDPSLRELAIQSGRQLLKVGRSEAGGTKWTMNKTFPRLMPNFSHGTAGVAYFLATLYRETKQKEFLDAALNGARYLQAVAKTEGDICMVFHNEPDGKDLYYLSWCHGPAGTARLFYRLYQITGERSWLDVVKRSARAILQSGVPEKPTPGFWNNVSQCCGAAGVGDFFLSLYQITRDKSYLDYTKRVTDNLLTRATRDAKGVKWMQAEHRVKPDLLVAQTGLMQGAAGIGLYLLRLDAFERRRKPAIVFPDTPF